MTPYCTTQKRIISVRHPHTRRSCGIIAGRTTARMMFGRAAPKLCSSPNTSPAQVFPLHRSQFKSRRAGLRPTHASMPCLLCLSPKNPAHHHATHPIFAAIRSRAARFPDAPSPTPDFPTGFFTTEADLPARFFITDARLPRRIALNCDQF